MTKTILITGGAGFIGSQLGHHLWKNGYRVILLDNMRYGHLDHLVVNGQLFGEFLGRDVRDRALAPHFEGVDTVFHFAGIAALPVCQANPAEAYDVNLTGTANVLELARRAGVRRVVFSSTSAVYEGTPTNPHAETDVIAPNLVYALTKAAAERLCEGYAKNSGLDIIVCRFFNVYGPHQDAKRLSPPFTSYVARELVAGRRPKLYNRSDARRDYVHVSDLIALLQKMLESPSHYRAEVFNVGSGRGFSVPELYGELRAIAGKDIEPVYGDPGAFWDAYGELFAGPRPLARERVSEEVHKHAVADVAKAMREFGWRPQMDLRAGLESVYRYAAEVAAAQLASGGR
jgi:nucleoside-diphosphate-sugar epimerase